jgi:RNA polymerase sigma factor (sigma-70 family)
VVPCSSAEAFFERPHPPRAGCLIVDLDLPGMGLTDWPQALLARGIEIPLILLSSHGDIPTTVRAIKAGAEDFLTKPMDDDVLLDRVRGALDHDASRRQQQAKREAVRGILGRLSDRELDVLRLVVQGKSNKEIGKMLGISHRTVEVHRARIQLKTATSTLIELASLARAGGLTRDSWA